MRIAIVTNRNGIGLEVDAELLSAWLTEHGHEAPIYAYDAPLPNEKFDVAILLEVCVPEVVNLSNRIWYFANPEWLKPEYIRFLSDHTEYIFAKTRAGEKALKEKFTNVRYTGFLTRDQYATVPRKRHFLHVGGNGGFRNTQAVLDAWRSYRYWNGPDAPNAGLTVVSNSNTVTFDNCPGITFIKRGMDEEIRRLQNECIYHLFPSAYEGWGHALHESQSVGAVLLTTAAPPMNEFGAAFLIPECGMKKKNFGELHEVSAASIREVMPKMLALNDFEIEAHSRAARALFVASNKDFGERFETFLSLKRPVINKMSVHRPVVAILGNLSAPHSTENDLAWTLKDMGCGVKVFQENEVTTEAVLSGCNNVSLLIYIHTHGWHTPGRMSVDDLIRELRAKRVTTASFHLDRYWGLNKLDNRENKIGEHPFWKTDYVFTADGGAHDWASRGVNHHWLPPGVVKRDCYLGERRGDLVVDVGFVGARAYHPEYPFRGELIEFLEGRYGTHFRLFNGYRGPALNDLYASISVVVGDSCFGGADRYWSDRVPESLGRGGFLIHPETPGLRIPGLVTFRAEDLAEMADRIDYFVRNPTDATHLSMAAMDWVYEHETYHNRMEQLLRVCGF